MSHRAAAARGGGWWWSRRRSDTFLEERLFILLLRSRRAFALLSPSTTTERRMLAGAGCVSSPVATSCYSDGPELIGGRGDDGDVGNIWGAEREASLLKCVSVTLISTLFYFILLYSTSPY